MSIIRNLCLAGLLCSTTAAVRADDLVDAARALCDKVKTCSMAHVAEEDMTPEMRQMMEPMLDNMCAAMKIDVQEVPTGHELYEPAIACMRSMAGLSCAQLEDPEQVQTQPCKDYEKLAREMGGE